jgi:hypothetical protein
MTVRKVVTRRSNHFRGYFPSLKNGKPVPWESQLEGAFYRLLELSPEVLSYVAQPSQEHIPFGPSFFTYYPDLRVMLTDGSEWWFEVKPQSRLQVAKVKFRLDAAARYFAATGRNFSVVTDGLIQQQPLARNLQQLIYHRRGPLLSSEKFAEMSEFLVDHGPKTISALQAVLGDHQAWRLLGLGVIGVDLNKPISSDSEIFLTGGHRHANLFS